MKQLIFVIEADPKNKSDARYIEKLITARYDLGNNEIKKQYIYMAGKGNYRSKAVVSKIKSFTSVNSHGENIIIYCFDTDRLDTNPEAVSKFNEEKEYCAQKQYYLIWFNYNIEYVLLGKNISSNQKAAESIKYLQNKNVNILVNKLSSSQIRIGCANVYLILDNILPKKQF